MLSPPLACRAFNTVLKPELWDSSEAVCTPTEWIPIWKNMHIFNNIIFSVIIRAPSGSSRIFFNSQKTDFLFLFLFFTICHICRSNSETEWKVFLLHFCDQEFNVKKYFYFELLWNATISYSQTLHQPPSVSFSRISGNFTSSVLFFFPCKIFMFEY